MSKKTRALTLSAMLIALTVVFLYVAALLPTSRIWVTAVAGLLVAAAVIESGMGAGTAVYIGSAIIAAIILPLKSVALLYILFFGLYPVLKSLIEKLNKRAAEWIIKILFFNISLTAMYLLWRIGFLSGVDFGIQIMAIIYAGGNFCFVMYDIAFTRLVQLYILRIHKKR